MYRLPKHTSSYIRAFCFKKKLRLLGCELGCCKLKWMEVIVEQTVLLKISTLLNKYYNLYDLYFVKNKHVCFKCVTCLVNDKGTPVQCVLQVRKFRLFITRFHITQPKEYMWSLLSIFLATKCIIFLLSKARFVFIAWDVANIDSDLLPYWFLTVISIWFSSQNCALLCSELLFLLIGSQYSNVYGLRKQSLGR